MKTTLSSLINQYFASSTHFRKNIQEWLFPGACLLCDARIAANRDLCLECEHSLPQTKTVCPCCAAAVIDTAGQAICGHCQTHPPAFTRTTAAFDYAAPIDRLIVDLKYHNKLYLARILGNFLADVLENHPSPLPDIIVSVPLHRSRLRRRGYNQALELARPVARRLDVQLAPHSVRRIRATEPQTNLPHKERARNVRRAFQASASLKGKHVAIVDDVMTTGHTVDAVAKEIKKAGAKNVEVWVVARA